MLSTVSRRGVTRLLQPPPEAGPFSCGRLPRRASRQDLSPAAVLDARRRKAPPRRAARRGLSAVLRGVPFPSSTRVETSGRPSTRVARSRLALDARRVILLGSGFGKQLPSALPTVPGPIFGSADPRNAPERYWPLTLNRCGAGGPRTFHESVEKVGRARAASGIITPSIAYISRVDGVEGNLPSDATHRQRSEKSTR